VLTLTVLEGPDTGTVFTFSDETIVIGRISDCNVMLHDATVSALHCEIRREENRFVLHARKSRNGTFINEQKERVDTHVLRNADRIRVGRSCLQVTLPEESSQEPSTTQPAKQDASEGEDANDRTKMQSLAVPPPGVLSLPADNELRVKLHIVDGPGTGSTFELPATATRFTVGRSPAVDFTLTDKAVSRTHFAIEITPTGVFLIDEGSLNGTFVRGERVSRCELHDGEVIRVC
jgi:pSer/pThr/pTyr-binding forkhead associated (FHA) protein